VVDVDIWLEDSSEACDEDDGSGVDGLLPMASVDGCSSTDVDVATDDWTESDDDGMGVGELSVSFWEVVWSFSGSDEEDGVEGGDAGWAGVGGMVTEVDMFMFVKDTGVVVDELGSIDVDVKTVVSVDWSMEDENVDGSLATVVMAAVADGSTAAWVEGGDGGCAGADVFWWVDCSFDADVDGVEDGKVSMGFVKGVGTMDIEDVGEVVDDGLWVGESVTCWVVAKLTIIKIIERIFTLFISGIRAKFFGIWMNVKVKEWLLRNDYANSTYGEVFSAKSNYHFPLAHGGRENSHHYKIDGCYLLSYGISIPYYNFYRTNRDGEGIFDFD
jgi:hypothetical protein